MNEQIKDELYAIFEEINSRIGWENPEYQESKIRKLCDQGIQKIMDEPEQEYKVIPTGFTSFPDAFDYVRECNFPMKVVVGQRWRLFPSGKAELIEDSFDSLGFENPSPCWVEDEPEDQALISQLYMEQVATMTRKEEAQELPAESTIFFI